MNLGTHMSDGERRKSIDIEVCRSTVKVTTSKNRTQIIVHPNVRNSAYAPLVRY
jgi:hypothetical protein